MAQSDPHSGMDAHLIAIIQYITGLENMTYDTLSEPILRAGLQNTYHLFIIQYTLLSLMGMVANIWMIYFISSKRLYRDNTHAFFINLSICHFVQSIFVLPITLVVIIVHNWILGQFMCYFVPMLQDIPLHAAVLTHILIAWDRMRWLGDPMSSRLPAFVCSCATWLTGMVIALPYPIYTTYLDLGQYLPKLRDVGICVVNLVDDSQEYTRGLFFILYIGPAVLLCYLYIRTSKDLRQPEGELSVMMFEQRADIILQRHQRHSTTSSTRSATSRSSYVPSYDVFDAQSDAYREKRTQVLLGTMAACEIICIGPLMFLRFARQQIDETYENSSHVDLSYLMLVWIAFLPTILCPCMYAFWMVPGPTKDRIWRYFLLKSRRSDSDNKLESQRSMEISITQENTTETLDIESKQPQIKSAHKPTSKVRPNSHSSSKVKTAQNRTNLTGIRNKNVRMDFIRPERTHSSDEMNNSCSNITASTYIKDNEVNITLNEHNEQKINYDRESVHSSITDRSCRHDILSDCGASLVRRESSSTYERDMDIIDLLERDRSMDLHDIVERERRYERIHKAQNRANGGMERRKLPDITKITALSSPKRTLSAEQSANFPNFVFTHQFNEFAEARSNRNRDSVSSNIDRSRNNSQTSFGKRNSDVHPRNEDDKGAGNINRVNRTRSIDSRKSSTKSVHDRTIAGNNYASAKYPDNL